MVLTALAPDGTRLQAAIDRARPAYQRLPGVSAIWRQDCHALPTGTEPFGYRDGISHPAVEGSGITGSNPLETPLKAGEFVLGYPDELGGIQTPQPEILGRNGTYVAFRKLHQRVAVFRRYLGDNATGPEDEELLAAKIMGRWRSGAPLALSPTRDDPRSGRRPPPQQRLPLRTRRPGRVHHPRRPLRRRLRALPRFVITRGGEYCFMPGLNALSWLGDLHD